MKKHIFLVALSTGMLLMLSCVTLLPSTNAVTISNESISPSTFSPDGNGLNDSITISFESSAGNDLYLNIFYNATQLVKSDLVLTESPAGTYRVTWNGKDDDESYVTDEGTYTIRVSENRGGGGGVIVGTATVDLTPPSSPSISINGGAQYTTSRSVNLTISASGASKMKISNYANFTAATWETYSTSKSWQLSTEDGEKTVYINFRDTAGTNISTSDTITLDTTLATPSLSINGGASATNNRTVSLSITATGATRMKIDNNTGFNNMTSWIAKASSYTFTLPEGADGSRTVYLRVKDDAGNVKTTSDSITLDRSAPTSLTFSINNDAAYTNNQTVTLSISASGGPQTIWLSNTDSSYQSLDYTTSTTWNLTSSDGSKTVYCKVSDAAGNNVSSSASITLDTTDPSRVTLSSPSSGATVTSQNPQFSWSNPNSEAQTKQFKIEILQTGTVQQSSYTNASTTSYTADTLPEGSYSWQVTVYDKANNSATTSQQSFTITVSGLATPAPTYPVNNARVNDTTPRLRWSQVSGQGTINYDFKYGNSSSNLTNTGSTTSLYRDTIEYEHGDQVFWAVRARNTSDTSNYSTIRSFTIDTEAPALNNIAISNNETYATSRSVTLALNATGASWMKLSEHSNFTDATWVTYSASKSFTLSSGDGQKTIYFKVKDNAVGDMGDTSYANINGTLNDTIVLDTQQPSITVVTPSNGSSTTTHSNLTIRANLADSTSGINTSSVTILFNGTDVTTNSNTTITQGLVKYIVPTITDGTYAVNVSAEDNAGHIAHQNWSFTVTAAAEEPGGTTPVTEPVTETQTDDTPTIANIQHTPTTITHTDEVTITADITDDNTLLATTVFWDNGQQSQEMSLQTSDTYSATIGPFTAGTTITYYIEATDNASQTTTSSTHSFTVEQIEEPTEEPTEEPSTPPVEETGLNITLTALTAGETTSASVNDTIIEEIQCTPTVNLTDVKITINKTTQQPEEVTTPQQKTIYLYLTIETTANASDLGSLKIKFKVPHTWINNNNLDKNSIILMRHHNNEWQELSTTLTSENETHAFYEAETPGTSIFAITATKSSEPSSLPPYLGYIALIIAAVIIAALIIAYRKKLFY